MRPRTAPALHKAAEPPAAPQRPTPWPPSASSSSSSSAPPVSSPPCPLQPPGCSSAPLGYLDPSCMHEPLPVHLGHRPAMFPSWVCGSPPWPLVSLLWPLRAPSVASSCLLGHPGLLPTHLDPLPAFCIPVPAGLGHHSASAVPSLGAQVPVRSLQSLPDTSCPPPTLLRSFLAASSPPVSPPGHPCPGPITAYHDLPNIWGCGSPFVPPSQHWDGGRGGYLWGLSQG